MPPETLEASGIPVHAHFPDSGHGPPVSMPARHRAEKLLAAHGKVPTIPGLPRTFSRSGVRDWASKNAS